MMKEFPKTPLNQVKRLPKRAQYDSENIYKIVDEALICHVGFVREGQPFVIPTIHARVNDTIYFHGAISNRMLQHAHEGNPICVTVTVIDGIVFARSIFHHSMNYRSAVLFGNGRKVEDVKEKNLALLAVSDHIAQGRWDDARKPTKKEIDATAVVALEIESASAKARSGPPLDDIEDYDLPVWAGVLPIRYQFQSPERDSRLDDAIDLPAYIKNYKR
jgi:uncharacterized protein